MKALLKILAGGLVFFMASAIAQEWDYFSSVWFGQGVRQAPAVKPEERQEAEIAVQLFLATVRHLHASGGDLRFAERLPASEEVTEELLLEVEYLKRNNRIQEATLVRLDPIQARPAGRGRVELFTREYWFIRTLRTDDRSEADPSRSEVVYSKYMLEKEESGFRVQAWDLSEPPAQAEPAPAKGG